MSSPTSTSDPIDICFVFGALRSGTTVFRLMLDHHPDLANPGEMDFLFDFIHPDPSHPTGWRYDREAMALSRIYRSSGLAMPEGLDGRDLLHDFLRQFADGHAGRMTLNIHRHAAKAAQLLPEARFIHMLRDGRDVANSSIGMGWVGNSYFGVDHWIGTERDWDAARDIIPESQRMELRFETLMQDLQGELERVCAFLDVPFEPAMLSYYETSSYSKPDPNIAQKWRRNATPRQIALLEGKCGDLLEARGYELSGAPAQPSGLELAMLRLENRAKRAKFNLKRLGPSLFLRFHAARLFGSKAMKDRLSVEKQAQIQRLLK